MGKTWNNYFFIIAAGVLFIIIILITVIVLGNKKTTQSTPIPKSSPSPTNPGSNTVTIVASPTPIPTVMMNKEGNKPVLSESDTVAEEQILSLLPAGQASGTVYESNSVTVNYDASADKFLAEILTEDIEGAKSETVSWFESQGMSQQGVCELPVIFYLSPAISQLYKIQGRTAKFNAIPDGCTQ